MKFIDLFAGAGGLRIPFDELGLKAVFSSEIDKFAQKTYYSYFGETPFGDITQITAESIPNHDILLAGFPCFTKGHLVFTSEGYKKIENITTNDSVLTHKNSFEKVVSLMKKTSNHFYELKIYGTPLHKVTSEHPYYVIEKIEKHQKITFSKPKWIETKDLIPTKHFIGININKNSIDIKPENYTKYIESHLKYKTLPFEIDEFYWFIGRYLADGWYQDEKRKDRKNSFVDKVFLCSSFEESEFIKIKLNALDLKYTVAKEKTVIKYIFSNKLLKSFFLDFGRYADGKVLPNFILDLPIEKLKLILDGYLTGDGYYDKKSKTNHITSINLSLILGFQNIVHKVYKIPARIHYRKTKDKTTIENRTVNQKDTYTLSFKNPDEIDKNSLMAFEKDGYMWFPVRDKALKKEDIEVFNFEVKKDNSYTVNNLIVHNCQPFSQAGKKEGFEDTRGTLFFNIEDILRVKQPQAFLLENVKGLKGHDKGRTFKVISQRLSELGYFFKTEVLRARDFGLPQNRERIFIVGFRDFEKNFNFKFPEPKNIKTKLGDILEENPDQKYTISDKLWAGHQRRKKEHKLKGNGFGYGLFNENSEYTNTISARYYKDGSEILIEQKDKNPRKLTPFEASQLQGFPKDFVSKARENGLSDVQLYKQMGNSVPVPVIREIAKNMAKVLKDEEN